MDLGNYETTNASGVSFLRQAAWYFFGAPLVRCYWMPLSGCKALLLKIFGARIGKNVRVKPGVRVKFPWKLEIGDHCWIGEDVWIDNLARVKIGNDACISQGVYLCTGNYDWSDPAFALKISPIIIEDQSWIAARSVVGPGVTVKQGAVLTLGSVATGDLEPMKIYSGNPAQVVKDRNERQREL